MAEETEPEPKTGRPSILTPELQANILRRLRKGMPLSLAAEACSVSRNTVHEWVRRGEGRDEEREPTPEYVAFATACREATAQGAEMLHDIILEAALGWRASRKKPKPGEKTKRVKSRMSPLRVGSAQWLLARRFPEDYGSSREGLGIVASTTTDGEGQSRPTITITYPTNMPADEFPETKP